MTTTDTPKTGKTDAGLPWGAIIALAVAIAAKFVIPALPVFHGASLGQVTGICNGTLGTLAQAFDRGAATDCATANHLSLGLNVVAGAAVIAALIHGRYWWRHRGDA